MKKQAQKQVQALLMLTSGFLMFSCGPKLESQIGFNNSNNDNHQVTTAETKQLSLITFEQNIKPLFKEKCSLCHNAASALPNLLNYDVAFEKKDRLVDRVYLKRDMPLVAFMTDEERTLVKQWVDDGAVRGEVNPNDTDTQDDTPVVGVPQPLEPINPPPPIVPDDGSVGSGEPFVEPSVLNFSTINASVFDRYCASCHNEKSPAVITNFGDYNKLYPRLDSLIYRVFITKDMPLDGSMPEAAREALRKWIAQGANKE